eukprot:GILK01004964.1.p1 GENE.GILK01004964.1~~GILK01004964.1.p1  ORF type:complete len:1287 (+),score=231.43 GILK01004964.1:166-3861(+)
MDDPSTTLPSTPEIVMSDVSSPVTSPPRSGQHMSAVRLPLPPNPDPPITRHKSMSSVPTATLVDDAPPITRTRSLALVPQPSLPLVRSGSFTVDPMTPSPASRKPRTAVFTWGHGEEGELLVGNTHNSFVPKRVSKLDNVTLVTAACGESSTLLVSEGGEVWAGGANEDGQLVPSETDPILPTPIKLETLSTQKIIQVSCGRYHTVCILETGVAISFGLNEFGQLGHHVPGSVVDSVALAAAGVGRGVTAKMMKGLSNEFVIQVACGEAHTLLLAATGKVFACGNGANGQLGCGSTESLYWPTAIQALASTPIAQIAAGDQHSGAVTVTGSVLMWGRNKFGQCGIGAVSEPQLLPRNVQALGHTIVSMLALGSQHSACVDLNGCVYTWGKGDRGQLGLGTFSNQVSPRPVQMFSRVYSITNFSKEQEIDGITQSRIIGSQPSSPDFSLRVRQIVCGSTHTLCLTQDGQIYSFGRGDFGQLGYPDVADVALPRHVETIPSNICIFEIAAGGEHSLALGVENGSVLSRPPMTWSRKPILHANLSLWTPLVDNAIQTDRINLLTRALQTLFSSSITLNASFLVTHKDIPGASPLCPNSNGCQNETLALFSSTPSAYLAEHLSELKTFPYFPQPCNQMDPAVYITVDPKALLLDVEGLETFYRRVFQSYNEQLIFEMGKALDKALADIVKGGAQFLQHPDQLRIVLIALQNPLLSMASSPVSGSMMNHIAKIWANLPANARTLVQDWIGQYYPAHLFGGRIVRPLTAHIDINFERQRLSYDQTLELLKLAQSMYEINEKYQKIAASEFYCEKVSAQLNIGQEYPVWRTALAAGHSGPRPFTYLDFAFLLDVSCKRRCIRLEAVISMQQEIQNAMLRTQLTQWQELPFLILPVHRDNLLRDTLSCISSVPHYTLRKPLKVQFIGEEGVDEGGVTKEFFQLLIREIFDVKYGLFTYEPMTRQYWFAPSIDSEADLILVGAVLGLAIYNGAILDVHFPQVVYKKLRNDPITFADLASSHPEIHKGLVQLLAYSNQDEEDVFCLTFQISYSRFGENVTHDLKPNGADIPVTHQNKKEFVDLYTKFLLEDSIKKEFQSFSGGFWKVCDGPSMHLLTASELEQLVCGTPHLDFNELEKGTRYEAGYTAEHPTIRQLWHVLHALSLEEKKMFLRFTTGSDRAPLGGLKNLNLLVQRNGPDSERLPTAYTCFNALLLPEYRDEATLYQRLTTAIRNSEGFGLK